MVRYKFRVNGMSCVGCERIVQNEIDVIDGVRWSDADHETGTIEFAVPDPETGSYVEYIINNLGYEVKRVNRA